MSKRISLTTQTHQFIKKYLNTGDIAIDSTVGNGHDTLFLARQVDRNGLVFGFDVQQQAIESTQTRLDTNLSFKNSTLFNTSHENLIEFIPNQYHGKVKAIMFNLGYLPGSDKAIITQTDSTLFSLNQAIKLLASNGVITIMAYPGHSGGDLETKQIRCWCKQLNTDKYVMKQIYSSEKASAPVLFTIQKN
ncbi:MAG: 16S rRNA (cytosine(1402)-N(4))-methyltransferase [Methylococcaceae bacterium]|nr:16S rRNA (cytosine(1402)-N(4))-methyltransferase [Methylococcaceae bacterium]